MTQDIKLALEAGLCFAREALERHDINNQRRPATEVDRMEIEVDIELLERALASISAQTEEKLDSTRTALVNTKAYWKPITGGTPRGARCFLANRRAKSATTGTVGNEEKFFTHYFPMPVFDPNEEPAP